MCLLNYVILHFYVIFFLLSCLHISTNSLPDGFSCEQKGTCSCLGSNGKLIDLSPLKNINHPIIASTNKQLYIYHPCTDIQLNSIVNNTCHKGFGICYFVPKISSDKPVDFEDALKNITVGDFKKLAENNEAVFRMNSKKQLEIVYKDKTGSDTITTIIQLECSKSNSVNLKIEKSEFLEHVLTLSTHYVCVESISGAAVFFLIVFILLGIYFIGGILVLKFIRGSTGIEMIPNHEFWCKLPILIKGGFTYLVNCGKNTPDSYEKI